MANPLLLPELRDVVLDCLAIEMQESGELDGYRSELVFFAAAISGYRPTTTARKALLSLAQTSHAISEPSLDRLWKSLDSLVPLIRCFTQEKDIDTELQTPPSPSEWAIIDRYAVRVRELRIMCGSGSSRSLHFLQSIAPQGTSTQPRCLLPNLRSLTWDLGSSYSTPFSTALMEPLLAPQLVYLDVTLNGEQKVSLTFPERLSHLSPNLKTLKWNFGITSVFRYVPILPAVYALGRCVVCLQDIKQLKLFAPFDPITLKHVILSPDFTYLAMMLDCFLSKPWQVGITPHDTPFPNVKNLDLEIWDLGFLGSLLRPHEQRFFQVRFILHTEGRRPPVRPMLSCFSALASRQRADSLQSIELARHRDRFLEVYTMEEPPENYCISYETLSPLASFHSLRQVMIILENQMSIDDDELTTLVRSWSLMEILYLGCRAGGWPLASAKYPTLDGLLAVIDACPQLYDLCFPIDARIVPVDANPDICNADLACVYFPDSLISDPHSVAAFFRKHLPSVMNFGNEPPLKGGDTEYLEECRRMWKEAENLLLYSTESSSNDSEWALGVVQ